MSLRLSGRNPSAYKGVEPLQPPELVLNTRSPAVSDVIYYNIGTIWVRTDEYEIWMLVNTEQRVGTWVRLYPHGGAAGTVFMTDDGATVVPAAGVVNVSGGNNSNTTGAGNTITIDVDTDVLDEFTCDGGTKAFPDAGNINILGDNNIAVTGNGTDTIDIELNNGTDGQVLIGGGVKPAWANITSINGSVGINNGEHSIDLSVAATAGSEVFQAYQDSNLADVLDTMFGTYIYYFGEQEALVEVVDTGGNFFPGDGAGAPCEFTAPATGTYLFYIFATHARSSTSSSVSDFPIIQCGIIPSNPGNIVYGSGRPSALITPNPTSQQDLIPSYCQAIIPLDMGDTVEFATFLTTNAGKFNLQGTYTAPSPFPGGETIIQTRIGGYLLG